jgi:hypothetical protein
LRWLCAWLVMLERLRADIPARDRGAVQGLLYILLANK